MARQKPYIETPGPRGSNGLTNDYRYMEQQMEIDNVARSIGCVAFRPDYHSRKRDGNTVLMYLPEDAEHNRSVDAFTDRGYSRGEAELYHISDPRYIYRDYFWSFENTDANDMLSLDYANRGTLDLRGLDAKNRIACSIMIPYYRKMQHRYVASRGGWLGLREADDTYNDYNIKRIMAFNGAYGESYIGAINPRHKDDLIFNHYVGGGTGCFGCDFIVWKKDDELEKLISAWRADRFPLASIKYVERITNRIEAIGGELFTWT